VTDDRFTADVEAVQEISIVPDMLDTLCRLTGMRFAAVARVTAGRWVACAVQDSIGLGLIPGGELELETTICHEVRQAQEIVAFDDADCHPVYAHHHTPKLYGFRSYISVPVLLQDGQFFGTLCALDPAPAIVSRPEIISTFKLFAQLIGYHLHSIDRFAASEALRAEATTAAELREQFLAVLGHDLRNPLAALTSGLTRLEKSQSAERSAFIRTMMNQSIARMSGLITNILDFARGRLGGGLSVRQHPTAIQPLVEQVVAEISAVHPERDVRLECSATQTLDCDPSRIAQLLSNLVANAVTHGEIDQPILVRCTDRKDHVVVQVSNGGEPIPENTIPLLFQPFKRGAASRDREGLGLGLYIAAEIARPRRFDHRRLRCGGNHIHGGTAARLIIEMLFFTFGAFVRAGALTQLQTSNAA
jgi:K+-sensing histidine kinase KdpD